jgi:sec-independent protein translocase protein TatC
MKHRYDEDLFAGTTMTFGEHLEDLRGALFRAVLGLVVGFGIGLCVGNYIVEMIKQPLVHGLESYYCKDAKMKYARWLEERKGVAPPPYTEEQIGALVDQQGLLFEIRYVDVPQAESELKRIVPRYFGDDANTSASASQTTAQGDSGDVPAAIPSETDPELLAKDVKAHLVPIFLWHHINDDPRIRPTTLGVGEMFGIWIKASLVLGAVISSPWVFYQIWSFVAAGLYPHEKKYVYKLGPFSLGLFLFGAATAYVFVFPPVLNFLFSFNSWLNTDPEPRFSEWLSFVLLLPIGFGISFQLPLVMLFLERIGIFSIEAYISKWRISVLVIFCLSAILTPGGDPYSIFFMALPLTGLYGLGILLCRWRPQNPNLWDESREEKQGKT